MLTRSERQEAIRGLLEQRGRLNVEELAATLRVTTMTIRRDLAVMEKDGVLTRTHGGCVMQSPFVEEVSFSEKDQIQRAQKVAIAREVVRRLEPGCSVYLDTGTTAVHVARLLPIDSGIRVFTNNLRVAMELFGRGDIRVVVYGGTLGEKSPDLAGEMAVSRMKDFRIDVAIMGVDALDVKRAEFYSADLATAMLSRAAQQQAEKTFVVVDSSKFGKHSIAVVGRLSSEITLITDEEATEEDRLLLEMSGVELVFAKTNIVV